MSDPIPLNTTKFSPLLISAIMLKVLRYFFGNMTNPSYRWDADDKQSAIYIGMVNDVIHDSEIQKKPRILVNRGPYRIQKTSLTGDLAEGKPMGQTLGNRSSKHMNFVSGGITVIIEAEEEGTCEILADMVSTFFTWSSDHICNTFRFKQFGYPMDVQECSMDDENKEKFKIVINTGYLTETSWVFGEDTLKLKGLFLELTN